MIAIARVSVNHDGKEGSAPDPLVSDQGIRKKQRKVDTRVNVDFAGLRDPSGFFAWSLGTDLRERCISGVDISAWPKSDSLLCGFTGFLASLHCPAGG